MAIDAASTMLRAAALLDDASRSFAAAFDAPVSKYNLFAKPRQLRELTAHAVEGTRNARAAAEALRTAGAPLDDVVRGVDQVLTDFGDPVRARLVHDRRYTAVYTSGERSRQFADLLRWRAELESLPVDRARARVVSAYEAAIDRPFEQMTSDDVWRIGVASLMPEQLRPPLASSARAEGLAEIAHRGLHPTRDNLVRGTFIHHRLELAARRAAADPAMTRELATAEARAIVELADDAITQEHLFRLSTLARLPDELRPELLDTRVPIAQHPMSDLAAWQWLPAGNKEARAKFDALRMAIVADELAASGAVTRQTVLDEYVAMLSKSNADLTHDDLRRISLLSRLPDELRVEDVPRVQHRHRFEDLGLLGYHPRDGLHMSQVVDAARLHVMAMADPDLVAATLRSQIDAGALVDLRIIETLGRVDGVLARHGITHEVLDQLSMRALARAGSGGEDLKAQLPAHLHAARAKLAAADPPAGMHEARAEAIELIDRNLERIAGTRTDTFGRHPDYAEIGRISSTTQLIDALVARPAAGAVDDAASLAW